MNQRCISWQSRGFAEIKRGDSVANKLLHVSNYLLGCQVAGTMNPSVPFSPNGVNCHIEAKPE